ncbi:hypothetical protein [Streptomyces sp. NPDC088707]|uniref:hypothetical protein n=1 Tax=Streptomyces sp. NPDC088707 TaxID=3365871 RepID=UPI0038171CC0
MTTLPSFALKGVVAGGPVTLESSAIHTEGLYVRGMMTLMALVGCGLAGGGLFGIGWLVTETLRR